MLKVPISNDGAKEGTGEHVSLVPGRINFFTSSKFDVKIPRENTFGGVIVGRSILCDVIQRF